MSNKIEQIVSKQKETSINYFEYIPHFKAYLDNTPTPWLNPQFGINNAKKISNQTTDQLVYTNQNRMEQLSLSTTNIGSKYLEICSARLGNKLIKHANQESASIDR